MDTRRFRPAPAIACALLAAAPAAAQTSGAALVGPLERLPAAAPRLPNFQPPEGDLREPGAPRRNGLIASWRIDEDLQIGIGRFTVPEIARPRTHMESERNPTAVRSRDRGIAAVGFSLRF